SHHEPLVLAQQFVLSAVFGDCGQRFERHDLLARSNDRVLPDALFLKAETIGIAYANGDQAIGTAQFSGDIPQQPGADLLGNLIYWYAHMGSEAGIHID